MNSYDLSRQFFDWSFENPEKITPTHVAMYFFIIEHCNRLGWKEKFGLPTTMVKEAIGIKNFRTYVNTLNELVEWGFIIMIEKSKNQYSSNIIAIVKNAKATTKASTKALDKALQKHSQKQSKSNDSIDKQETIKQETIKQETIKQEKSEEPILLDWENLFNEWFEYKKARRESYKNEQSENAFKDRLRTISKENIETAREIIKESMANNWAGIFQLKNNQSKIKPAAYNNEREITQF